LPFSGVGYGLAVKRSSIVAVWLVAANALLSGCVVATTSDSRGNGGGLFVLAVPLLLVLFVLRMARRGRRRRSPARQASGVEDGSAPNLAMMHAEVSVLADDVIRLEPQVALHPDARSDYDSATHRYRVAQAALDQAGAQVDPVRLQRVVDEATYAMSRARAVIEGRTPPPPQPVLQQTGTRGEPAVALDDRMNPTYVGSAAPFRSGWFGVGGGLFGGLLMGSMFGGLGGWEESDDSGTYDDRDQLG
jgi:hypothetical protein